MRRHDRVTSIGQHLNPTMAESSDPFPKLGDVYKRTGSKVQLISQDVAGLKINHEEALNTKGNSLQSGTKSGRTRRSQLQNSHGKTSGNSKIMQIQTDSNSDHSRNGSGTSWKAKDASSNSTLTIANQVEPTENSHVRNALKSVHKYDPYNEDLDDDESDAVVYHSDEDDFEDEIDFNSAENRHEALKKCNWFRKFFAVFDKLTLEEINSHCKKWHCPACKGGRGAITWYYGIYSVIAHAKAIQSRRLKLHRTFVDMLEEEFARRGVILSKTSEAYGKWKGLDEQIRDFDIVWPPMVVIMNTRYQMDDNGQWTGMGSQELLDCFSSYAAFNASHSYGPQGHSGISLLIFQDSAIGYVEACRMHKHFVEQGLDRNAWYQGQDRLSPDGKRQLFGFLATKDDLDEFNRHAKGKSKVKFEIKSHHEMVGSKIKDINVNRQQVMWYKNEVAKEKHRSKSLLESLNTVGQHLRVAGEVNRTLRQTSKSFYEQSKEEMECQENYYKNQGQNIHLAVESKEVDDIEKPQQINEKEKFSQ